MKKDITIINLIERLKSEFNFNLIKIIDYWESDLCAIGLKKGNRLVYISTFNYIDNKDSKFDFDLEIVDKFNLDKIELVKEIRGASETDLIKEIKSFLGSVSK